MFLISLLKRIILLTLSPQNEVRSYRVYRRSQTGKIGIQTKVKHKTILSLIFGHKLMGARD